MASRAEFLAKYSQAAELAEDRDERLTPAEFMLASNPGTHKVNYRGHVYYSNYSNADSASRAFRKIRSGETSGERMFARAELYPYSAGYGPDTGWRMDEPRGGVEEGLWKVVVHFEGTDANGNEFSDMQKSFIVQSDRYNSYYDAKQVEYETGEEVDAHMEAWTSPDVGYGFRNASVTYIEVIHIQYTTRTASQMVFI